MTGTPLERAKAIIEQVRARAGAERESMLDDLCGDDAELRGEVESLLAHAEAAPEFLAEPPPGVVDLAALDADDLRDPEPTGAPETIGPYRVLRRVATGGMGAVYEAVQDRPRRRVALKMVRPGLVSPYALRRFRREAELLGRLQHPGIAQIFHAGTTGEGPDERPYFVMEFVGGLPLTRHVREAKLDVPARLGLFLQICDAVDHAHEQGVVHRDLKPDNILVAAGGTTSGASEDAARIGQPKVLDFGVARATDGQALTQLTRQDQVVGTLPYMSPEQVGGGLREPDRRSDVYALGVLLYELLTDRLPHDLSGRTLPEAARIICEEDPAPLGTPGPARRGDLEVIVGKALERDPDRRYPTAAALAEDVARHLRHQPIHAKAPSAIYQLRKFARRNRGLVTGLGVATLALVAGSVFAVHFGLREARHRGLAEERGETARFNEYQALVLSAQASMERDPLAAASALQRAPEEHRGWEWRLLDALSAPTTWSLEATGGAGSAAFGQDGLALYAFAGDDGVELARESTGAPTLVLPGLTGVERLALSPGGRDLAVAGQGRLRLWSVQGSSPLGAPRLDVALEPGVTDLAFSADRSTLVVVTGERTAAALDATTGEPRYAGDLPGRIQDLAPWPDGSRVLVGLRAGQGSHRIGPGGTEPRSGWGTVVAVAPNGATQALLGEGVVQTAATGEGEALRTFASSGWPCSQLAFDPTGEHLVGIGPQGLRVWAVETGELTRTLGVPGPASEVLDLRVSPDGARCAAATTRGVLVWDLTNGPDLDSAVVRVRTLAFSPDGRWLAAAGEGFRAQLFDTQLREPLVALTLAQRRVNGLAFSADGSRLLVSSGLQVLAWDAPVAPDTDSWTGPAEVVQAEPDPVALVRRYSSGLGDQNQLLVDDGRRLLRGFRGGFELVERSTGVVVRRGLPAGEDTHRAPAVAMSPDGTLVATGSMSGAIRLWSAETGEQLARLEGHTGAIHSLDVHPDGRRLVSAGQDGVVRLWDTARREPVLALPRVEEIVRTVAFSPDGEQLAVGTELGRVLLWDALPRSARR